MNDQSPHENQNEEDSGISPQPKKAFSFSGITSRENINRVLRSLSRLERRVFLGFCLLFSIGAIGLLLSINTFFLVTIPAQGGSITEGVIGAPRFINPLLAISDADRDITQLVYSGLMRATPDGKLVPDLANTFTVSEDGLVYTFTLREGLKWHDGKPITSDDIIFTISKVQDSVLKSPKRASWEGVRALKQDEKTISFTLEKAYSPFLENTTLGILPKHIWEKIGSEQFGFSKFNTEPIGSGPYKINSIKKDSSGIPKVYSLQSFRNFALERPYINSVTIRFYANEEKLLSALDKNEIGSVNALPAEKARELEEKGARIEQYVLPRVFGVFFNQSQNPIFTSTAVRKALDKALDKESLIQDVLFGYATALEGPLPPGALGYMEDASKKIGIETSHIDEARKILEKAGWELNEETNVFEKKSKKQTQTLSFSIATSDAEELKRAAFVIRDTWKELGADVDLKIFNTSDLNQNIIRPRKYDALFFGEIIGRESDPFPFWHSSQRNDPGLNIALYANITTDSLLEDGRVSFDRDTRINFYEEFEAEVKADIPAVFVYSPDFLYVLPKKILGITGGTITTPSERFIDIHTWYIEQNKVWKFFTRTSNLTP